MPTLWRRDDFRAADTTDDHTKVNIESAKRAELGAVPDRIWHRFGIHLREELLVDDGFVSRGAYRCSSGKTIAVRYEE